MSKTDAETYLQTLLNKTLRITTTDTRMFHGQFKCTDSGRNIILSHTFEFRAPTPPSPTELETAHAKGEKVVKDMTSRFLGLVVVPGEHIVRIVVEEFASQVKVKGKGRGRVGVLTGPGVEV